MKNSIDKNIEILEEKVEVLNLHIANYGKSNCKTAIYQELVKERNALVNVLEELKTRGKMIDSMAEHIVSSAIVDDTVCAIKCDCETNILEDCTHKKMLNCTKEYFRKEAEENVNTNS